jgi:hypothetical protein
MIDEKQISRNRDALTCAMFKERLKDCSESIHDKLTLANDQLNVWHLAQINIPALSNPYKIVLKSIRGSGTHGDTAIDDLEYYTGKCRGMFTLYIFYFIFRLHEILYFTTA